MKNNEYVIGLQDEESCTALPSTANHGAMVRKQIQKLQMMRMGNPAKEGTLKTIPIVQGQLHLLTGAAEDALLNNSPEIFQRGGQLVRIVTEASRPKKRTLKDGRPNVIMRSEDALVIIEVDSIYLAELLGRIAKWTKLDERTQQVKDKDCPEKVAKTLLARREWTLPVLAGVIQAPTLRSDGSILENPGYDEGNGIIF